MCAKKSDRKPNSIKKSNSKAHKKITRSQSQYIIDYDNKTVTTYAKLKRQFGKSSKELKNKYGNNVDNYIRTMCLTKHMLIVEYNNYIVSNRLVTPLQFALAKNINGITPDISLAEFDRIVADNLGLWNYPLDEYNHIVENNLKVVIVKFKNDEYRFVEV